MTFCYAEKSDAIGCWLSKKRSAEIISTSASRIRQKEQVELQTSERRPIHEKLDPIKGEADRKEGRHQKSSTRIKGKRSLPRKMPSVLNTLRLRNW